MKPTAVWQATYTGANVCPLLIYLPVAFWAAQDLITACSWDAKHICLKLLTADQWAAAVCHPVWILLPVAGHSCYVVTWTDPKPRASLDYCIPSTWKECWKGLSQQVQLWPALAGQKLVVRMCRNPCIQLTGYTKRAEVLERMVCCVVQSLWTSLWEGYCKPWWLRGAWKLNPV